MRMVPRNASLKSSVRKCFTKRGRSVDPFCGSHCTAWPLRSAIEVNVPHSCAMRLGFEVPSRAARPETAEPENITQASNAVSRSERVAAVDMPVILPTKPKDDLMQSKPKVPRLRRIAERRQFCFARDDNFIRVEQINSGRQNQSENFPGQYICLDLCFDACRGRKVIPRGTFFADFD